MRTLPDLLASSDGRAFLETRGVLATEEAFVDRLGPAARDGLARALGLDPETLPVYAAHQVKADYPPSVISKIRAARDLENRPGIVPVLLWLDMDRAGADRQTTGVQLRGRGGALQVRLSSGRHDDKEVRFVPVERGHLEEVLRRLEAWARQHGAEVADRESRLAEALLAADPRTLAESNLVLTSFLLREQLAFEPPSLLVSDLAPGALLTEALEDTVNRIDDVVTVFNAAVDSLVAADVDPQVRHLGPEYLPLHYSCDRDDRRCKLIRERRGADLFAVAKCVCGERYEFHLGAGSLSIAELAKTGRWSTDVTLPLYLNDLASGVVAGRSSALYGLVLNEVLEKVLARNPIPMLVPEDLPTVLAADRPGGLMADYLTGR